MNFIKLILYAALGVVLFYVGVLVYHTIWDWKPAQVLPVAISHPHPSDEDESLEFLIWNVGFGGLGAETSFFYDGGETVIPEEAWTYKNEQGIRDVLKKHQHVEFVLLQEVDSLARRSHFNNQIRTIHTALNRHSASFALNYNVAYVPLPIFNGMGEVRSGLASYSRLATHNNQRHAFDTQFEWPRQVFFLDRCFLVQHAQWQGKEIVVINTHCSAYDETGEFVAAEIQKMIDYG
ncbi:MAG: hypothetical protein KDC12_15700, partial [Flavobacteriales bacterium]|nr:hypothetical protein [Flavobacteriales bacterium]